MSAKCLTAAWLTFWLVTRGWAQPFVEISGTIALISHVQGEGLPVERARTFPFNGIIGENTWSFRGGFNLQAEDLWFFDGTNTFSSAAGTYARGLPAGPAAMGKDFMEVLVHPGNHPPGMAGPNLIWLAFFSGRYLRQPDRLIPSICTDPRVHPEAYGYMDTTECFEDALRLPRLLVLRTSHALFDKSVAAFQSRLRPGTRLPPSPDSGVASKDGQLHFHYAVDDYTNYSGWLIPIRFTFSQYAFNRSHELMPETSGSGIVTAVKESSPPVPVLVAGTARQVTDFRLADAAQYVSAAHYTTTNGLLAPIDR